MDTVLASVKILLGIAVDDLSKDEILQELYNKTIDDICGDCNDEFLNDEGVTEFPKGLIGVFKELIITQYRRLGAEGRQGEAMGDYSATYFVLGDDMTKSIKRKLYAYRKMRVH